MKIQNKTKKRKIVNFTLIIIIIIIGSVLLHRSYGARKQSKSVNERLSHTARHVKEANSPATWSHLDCSETATKGRKWY
jgi:uncharacterized membrane protein YfhO